MELQWETLQSLTNILLSRRATSNGYRTRSFVAKCFASGTWLWGVGSRGNDYFRIHAGEGGNITLSGYFSDSASFGSFALRRPRNIRGGTQSNFVARLTGDKLTSQRLVARLLSNRLVAR